MLLASTWGRSRVGMSSEAVLVEWMDILSSAEAKVREFFFEKTFSRFVFDECLSPWFPLYSFFFHFSRRSHLTPLCLFDLAYVRIYPPYFWSRADCGLFAGTQLFFYLFWLYLACALLICYTHTHTHSLLDHH